MSSRSRLMLVSLLLVPALIGYGQQDRIWPPSVAAYRGCRLLLLFVPSNTDPRLTQQIAQLVHSTDQLAERQVTIFVFSTDRPVRAWKLNLDRKVWNLEDSEPQDAIRRRFQVTPHGFTVVLLGKDGGEKFRSLSPVPAEKLFGLIDAMPIRQSEMRQKAPTPPR